MKHRLSLALLATLLATPSVGEETSDTGLMRRGADMFFEGLRQEMAPALNNLKEFADQAGPDFLQFMNEMGPAFTEILNDVQDWSRYSPPETLPNGDIIIRRKPDPEPEDPPKGDVDI